MFSIKAKIDKEWIEKIEENFLKQARLVISLVSIIMFLSGSWEKSAEAMRKQDDPETVIRVIVEANAKMDLKTLETHMAADEDTVGYTIGGRKYIGRKDVKQPIKPLAVERKVMPIKARDILVEMDLTGLWEIQEEDKSYQATLNAKGNGPYNWQEGRIHTEKLVDRLWSGTWHQKGNDREGGFEVLLSEDGKTADGVWWYLRVGTQKNIPPREWGGTYKIKRLSP